MFDKKKNKVLLLKKNIKRDLIFIVVLDTKHCVLKH